MFTAVPTRPSSSIGTAASSSIQWGRVNVKWHDRKEDFKGLSHQNEELLPGTSYGPILRNLNELNMLLSKLLNVIIRMAPGDRWIA